MNRFLHVIAALSFATPTLARTNCPEQVKPSSYPPLARQARISGEVKAHFDVGVGGGTLNVVTQGHVLLSTAVESLINNTIMEAECSGSFDLIYKFGFDNEINNEVHTSVVFNPPNEYVITTNHPYGNIDYGVVLKRPWYKRLFHL